MGKWTLERTVMVACLLITVGMNWQRVWSQSDDIAALKKFNQDTLKQEYVSKEIYDLNQQHLTEAIDRLTVSLEKLYALEQQTGEPARIQRDFAR